MASRKKRKNRKPNVALQVILCILAATAIFTGLYMLNKKVLKKTINPADTGTTASEVSSLITPDEISAESSESDSAEETASAENPAAEVSTRSWVDAMDRYLHDENFWEGCPPRDVQLLTPNPYSRPGTQMDEVHDIVIHYVDEPGSTAQQNRDYFESLKDGSRSASSHFIISLDGSIIQCIPLGEISYASNHRNFDTISIENCHPDATGKFTDDTYLSCVALTAWLLYAFDLPPDRMIRHYDVTEKLCPIYYVEHPDAWEQMKVEVAEKYEEYKKLYPR